VIQRFKDWRHERYIDRLARRCERARTSGDRLKAKLYWDLMVVAIRGRSVAQVRRMERAQGLG